MNYTKAYDIIVLGGGFSGCAAAIAAARQGEKVLLLESSGCLGGAATNCLVFPFMIYYTNLTDENGEKHCHDLSRGIFAELADGLRLDGDIHAHHFSTETLKLLLDRKTTEAGVDVLFHATLCDAKKEGNRLTGLSVITKSGLLSFTARYFIDCSGDAALCAMTGVPTRLGRESDHLCQPMTLCFRVANVDKVAYYDNLAETQKIYKEWLEAGKFRNPRENILSNDYPVDGMMHFNTTRVVKLNPVDPFDVTKAEMEARLQIQELMEFFRVNHIPGMERAELVYSGSEIGVRESRMLDGAYLLTVDDLLACTKFDDAIAAGNYDIDIHNPEGTGTSNHYFDEGTWYTIPYRALTPKETDAENLLTAGRCISVTHEAQASIRIMPICCTTGEAAGVAAAVADQSGKSVQQADIGEIQRILTGTGAYIGL